MIRPWIARRFLIGFRVMSDFYGSQGANLTAGGRELSGTGLGNHAALRQTTSRAQNRCTRGSVSRRPGLGNRASDFLGREAPFIRLGSGKIKDAQGEVRPQ